MDRLAEGQEELRGELGVLAERFDALAGKIQKLNDRQESLTSGRQGKDKILLYVVLSAGALSAAALLVALLR
jgi:hypothetical protein